MVGIEINSKIEEKIAEYLLHYGNNMPQVNIYTLEINDWDSIYIKNMSLSELILLCNKAGDLNIESLMHLCGKKIAIFLRNNTTFQINESLGLTPSVY